jgi:hypothetical protein
MQDKLQAAKEDQINLEKLLRDKDSMVNINRSIVFDL